MYEDMDESSVMDRERAYYPKIRELIDLLNRMLLLLHENAMPGEKLIPQQVLINRCRKREEPESVQIFLEYGVSSCSASPVISELDGRIERYIARKNVSLHRVCYVCGSGEEDSWTVEPGNIGIINLLTMTLHRWESEGAMIGPRHGISCGEQGEQEIFWVDLKDYQNIQDL